MLAPIVLVALALFGGAALALAPIPTTLVAAVIVAALRRGASRRVIVLALVALLLGGLRARAALEGAASCTVTPPSCSRLPRAAAKSVRGDGADRLVTQQQHARPRGP